MTEPQPERPATSPFIELKEAVSRIERIALKGPSGVPDPDKELESALRTKLEASEADSETGLHVFDYQGCAHYWLGRIELRDAAGFADADEGQQQLERALEHLAAASERFGRCTEIRLTGEMTEKAWDAKRMEAGALAVLERPEEAERAFRASAELLVSGKELLAPDTFKQCFLQSVWGEAESQLKRGGQGQIRAAGTVEFAKRQGLSLQFGQGQIGYG